MAAGNLVLAFGTPENLEVTSGTALVFDRPDELAAHLTAIARDPEADVFSELRSAALKRVIEHYSWDSVTAAYEALFEALVSGGDPHSTGSPGSRPSSV